MATPEMVINAIYEMFNVFVKLKNINRYVLHADLSSYRSELLEYLMQSTIVRQYYGSQSNLNITLDELALGFAHQNIRTY